MLAADQGEAQRIREMVPKLKSQDFHDLRLLEVWIAVFALFTDGKSPSPLGVIQWLSDKGRIEQAGGRAEVSGLPECAPMVTAFEGHLLTLKAKSRDRLRLESLNRMAVICANPALDDGARESALRESLTAMGDTVSASGESAAAAFEMSVLHCSDLASMEIPAKEFIVAPFFREGDLAFIHGPRGLGKTWISLMLAIAAASGRSPVPWFTCRKRNPVLVIDGEMTLDAVRTRTLSLGAGTCPLYILSHEQFFAKTGKIFNLSDPRQQDGIVELCRSQGVKVIILDNLSCLFSGLCENDADSWEQVLPWLLTLRRHGIAVIVVAHSGRNGSMRGTSRREDAAAWILRLDESQTHTTPGAKFIATFSKNRHATEDICPTLDWSFSTGDDGKVIIDCRLLDDLEQLRQAMTDGLTRCGDIAESTGWSRSKVSKTARKAVAAGWLAMDGRNYQLK